MEKGMFFGAYGQRLDDKLKEKLDDAIKMAIEDFGITDFYFYNEPEDEELAENTLLKEAISENKKISEYIAEKIKEYKGLMKEREIKTAMVVARPNDKNYTAELYDEIIQGYYIYGLELEDANSLDAYTLRDTYLANHIDIIFWYSNKILENTSNILQAVNKDTIIQYI